MGCGDGVPSQLFAKRHQTSTERVSVKIFLKREKGKEYGKRKGRREREREKGKCRHNPMNRDSQME